MNRHFSCLKNKLFLLVCLPGMALASVPLMPEYDEVATGLTVSLITSLHTSGPDVTEEDGMPKGWPAASYPRGIPLLVQGLNGSYLYTSVEGGGILRVPPAPSVHYQTAVPYEAYKRIPALCSGYYCGDEERNWEDEFDELGRLVRHKGDTIGALVQRANGDLVGAIYAEEEQTGNYGGYAMTEALKNGALYRTDYDATHGTVIASTVGKLIRPFGVLVVDGNKVYGTDVGTDGNGRLFRLNEDDSIDFIHDFGPGPDGQKQVPNGFILGQDGALYGVTAYFRGEAFTDGTPTALSTPTGSLYRIDPNTPESFTVLHSLTLAEGEVMTIHPENRLQSNSALNWLVEKDGWLYGTVAIGQCHIIPTTNNNARRNHPLCGTGQDSEHWLQPAFPYYDVPETVFGAVYRIRTTGSNFQILHRFNYDDGATPRGPLAVGMDGYIYGTTVSGGLHESVTNPLITPYPLWVQGRWFSAGNLRWHSSCVLYDGICRLEWYSRDGVIYRIVPDQIQANGEGEVTSGGFELVHHFRRAESGKGPLGIARGRDGVLYGTTANGGGSWISKRGDEHYADRFGTVFMLGAASEASVTLTLNPAEAVVGHQVELTWTSHLAENCVASSSAGDWTGAQEAQGSVELYSASVGSFTYVLVCSASDTGAQVSSTILTLRVGRPATENDGNTISYKEGGSFSQCFTLLLAALMFWRARRAIWIFNPEI